MAVRSSQARQRPKHREGEITGSGGQTPTPGAGPVAGTMDPVRPQIREQLIRDCASLDWSTDPHQTPSGGSRALTPDRSETPATGLCSKGIDTRGPVTEARISQTSTGIACRYSTLSLKSTCYSRSICSQKKTVCFEPRSGKHVAYAASA